MSWLRLMEESIKENEHVAEPDNSPEQHNSPEPHASAEPYNSPQPQNSRAQRKVIRLIREMWPAYLIEILVIILGISITLALEEWRDTSKEKQLEKIYLGNLLADIQADQQSLNYATVNTQKLLDRGNELIGYIRGTAGTKISPSEVNADLLAILGRPKFISNDATFSDLKNSGNLHLLKDIQLKNQLFVYYNLVQIIKEIQDAEQQATIILSGSYFLKRFPMSGGIGDSAHMPGPAELSGLVKDIEFGNNVYLRVTTRKELLDIYQKAGAFAKRLSDALSEKTGSR